MSQQDFSRARVREEKDSAAYMVLADQDSTDVVLRALEQLDWMHPLDRACVLIFISSNGDVLELMEMVSRAF